MGTGKGTRIGGALQLNAATVAMFAGNKITAVLVANGSTKSTTTTSAPIEVFCTKTLDGTPIAKATGQMDYTNTKNTTRMNLLRPSLSKKANRSTSDSSPSSKRPMNIR